MVATIAAGTTAGYYLAQSEYYLGGSEPPGQWLAGDVAFGIDKSATVEAEVFERLHAGKGSDGKPLLTNGSGRPDRVPGYDLTFSAPKSVSVLWALCDEDLRHRIDKAQERAVEAALGLVERNAAFSRRGRGGLAREAVLLNVATFRHGEARPTEHADGRTFADPQLHTHAVILNLARRADGSVGTLDGRRLFAWKMAAGAAYHLALAGNLQKLGLTVAEVGRNGTFEIAGIDPELREYFSARRAEVETALGDAGTTSASAPALAGAITKASRSAKQTDAEEDRFAGWRAIARAHDHEPARVVDGALSSESDVGNPLELLEPSIDVRAQLRAVPEQLTVPESVFDRRQLIAAVSSALVGTAASVEEAEKQADKFIERNVVVELAPDAIGERRYSTPELIRIEREILETSTRMARRSMAVPDRDLVGRLIVAAELNGEQADAVEAATAPAGLSVIEGVAGSGKTTALRPIVAAYQAAGYRVLGSATAWRIARQLNEDLDIDSRATDSWLAGRAAGLPFLSKDTVLIVDEAGQLSSRQMHALMGEADHNGAKLLLVGDRRQLQPIGAGGALSIVAKAVAVQRVDHVVRQKAAWARRVTNALAAGKTAEALSAYAEHDLVRLAAGSRSAVQAAVDVWDKATLSGEGSCLLLARTNGQVRELNAEVRRRMRERGMLYGADVTIDAVTSSGQTYLLPLAIGDEIRFLVRNDTLGVVNGSTGIVTGVSERQGAIRITTRIAGRDITFGPTDIADETGRARLGHAYASTIYSAQGLTVDRASVLLDPACDRHDTYVALSRAREETVIIGDRTLIDTAMRAERPLSERAAAAETDEASRVAWLGQRLSRAAVKGTTLDALPQAMEPKLEAKRAMSLERGLGVAELVAD